MLHMSRFGSVSLYRLWSVLQILIYAIGLFAPWGQVIPAKANLSSWLVLAAEVARQGWTSFTGATVTVLVLATLLAFVAAALRTWEGAWVAGSRPMRGAGWVRDGLSRQLRHASRLGLLLHTVVLAVLMPPAGAVFAIGATALLQGWLMLNEGRSLPERMEAAHQGDRGEAPAVVPGSLASALASARPAWRLAALSQVYFWGVAVSFAALGWRYNAFLLDRCVLVSFGVGLVVRALLPKPAPAA